MKYLFALITLLSLYSCSLQSSSEDVALKNRVAILEARVDSLTAVLNSKGIIPEESRTRNNYSNNKYSTPRPSPKPHSYSGQCQAITRKGYQCSRRARSGGYCWQHGG